MRPRNFLARTRFSKRQNVQRVKEIVPSNPDVMTIRFKNKEFLKAGSSAVSNCHALYLTNSLFDPQSSLGTGMSSLIGNSSYQNVDEWLSTTAFFQVYKVVSMDISVKFVNQSTTDPLMCTIYTSLNTTDTSSPASYTSHDFPGAVSKMLTPAGGDNDSCVLSLKGIKTYKLYGDAVNQDEDYAASYNASPSRIGYVHIDCFVPDGSADIAATIEVNQTALAILSHANQHIDS